ncbi:hypothetical protein [Marinovum algicola]|uniref:hypothetical protein n=1 Tax=Marinovum algicola TaxID=42444 RepID=UPI003B51F474
MSRYVKGADRVRRKMNRLHRVVQAEVERAIEKNGEDLVRGARVLHPGDGETRAEIKGRKLSGGGYLVDMGSKAKVTEGDRGPRPYINPVLKAFAKRHKGRVRRAVNKAVKRVFS